MKKLFNKWVLPVCSLLIIVTQLLDYYLHGDINPATLVVWVALFPATLKSLDYKVSKKLEWLMTIFAVMGMIYVIKFTFF